MMPIAMPIASTTSMSVNPRPERTLNLKPKITQRVLLFVRQPNHLAKPVHNRRVFVPNDHFNFLCPARVADLFVGGDFRLGLPCPTIEWWFKRFRSFARKY